MITRRLPGARTIGQPLSSVVVGEEGAYVDAGEEECELAGDDDEI